MKQIALKLLETWANWRICFKVFVYLIIELEINKEEYVKNLVEWCEKLRLILICVMRINVDWIQTQWNYKLVNKFEL